MLTSRMTQEIAHPDEPGVTFTLRKLSYQQVEEAATVKQEKLLNVARQVDGLTIPDPFAGMTPDERDAARAKAQIEANNPETKYDRATVLKHGIVGWSYDAPCDATNIADLDESTSKWLFAAIIMHSLRSADEGEASASGSTATSA